MNRNDTETSAPADNSGDRSLLGVFRSTTTKLGPVWVMTIAFALAMFAIVAILFVLAIVIFVYVQSSIENAEGAAFRIAPALGDWACSSYWSFLLAARENGLTLVEIEDLFTQISEEGDSERIATVCGTPADFYRLVP